MFLQNGTRSCSLRKISSVNTLRGSETMESTKDLSPDVSFFSVVGGLFVTRPSRAEGVELTVEFLGSTVCTLTTSSPSEPDSMPLSTFSTAAVFQIDFSTFTFLPLG